MTATQKPRRNINLNPKLSKLQTVSCNTLSQLNQPNHTHRQNTRQLQKFESLEQMQAASQFDTQTKQHKLSSLAVDKPGTPQTQYLQKRNKQRFLQQVEKKQTEKQPGIFAFDAAQRSAPMKSEAVNKQPSDGLESCSSLSTNIKIRRLPNRNTQTVQKMFTNVNNYTKKNLDLVSDSSRQQKLNLSSRASNVNGEAKGGVVLLD